MHEGSNETDEELQSLPESGALLLVSAPRPQFHVTWAQGPPVEEPHLDHPLLTNPILMEVVVPEEKINMTCPVTTFLEMLEELEALVAEQNGTEFDHRHAVREVRVTRIYDQRECDSLRAEEIYVQQVLEELLTVVGCTGATACNFNPAANLEDKSCVSPTMWYTDADGDGLGDLDTEVSACSQPEGFVADDTDNCDDLSACNYDDAGNAACVYGSSWYADEDGDGLGNAAADSTACTQPSGYVSDDTDNCDDLTACNYDDAANPACVFGLMWYADDDGDGRGDVAADSTACTQPTGFVSDDTDACDEYDGMQLQRRAQSIM